MSSKFILFLCLAVFGLHTVYSAMVMTKRDGLECGSIPQDILEEVLGSSFNPRYMSIQPPTKTEPISHGLKRASNYELDFYVDGTHYEELTRDPAWVIKSHVKIQEPKFQTKYRFKRSSRRRLEDTYADVDDMPRPMQMQQDWQCKSQLVWTDLGPDYFPRYLRSVECRQTKCWFSMYKCQARSFAVKILRRKRNLCVLAEKGMLIGYTGLPRDLREMWVWEERAVNFCCDCTLV